MHERLQQKHLGERGAVHEPHVRVVELLHAEQRPSRSFRGTLAWPVIMPGVSTRSNVNTTSSAVSGSPFWNLTPLLSVKS
ncbi:MAG TPA: hypothetical protein VK587_12035 [bacterium]|nr:hypothetical protein [bacterium]